MQTLVSFLTFGAAGNVSRGMEFVGVDGGCHGDGVSVIQKNAYTLQSVGRQNSREQEMIYK